MSSKADVTMLKSVESQLRQLASEVNKSQGGSAEELHRIRREVMAAMDGKADGRHVAALVDQKVSVSDMNEALGRLSKAINATALEASTSVGEEEMSRLSGEVASLHQRRPDGLLPGPSIPISTPATPSAANPSHHKSVPCWELATFITPDPPAESSRWCGQR